MALLAGTRLGPYEIVSPLGAGGMGEVYRARDTRLERDVAVKVLPAALSRDAGLKQRLEREAKAISRLSHPHICTLHDIGQQDGIDFLVMELLEGETLEQRLLKGPLPPDQTIRYAAQIADALGSVSFDHPDPSIFLVLQSQSDTPGVDMIDFVVFPPRILAMEHTFRPPWFHRNVASEFMGLVHGVYDAKAEGFVPGGASLHNCMSGHGPDADTFEKASTADTSKAHYIRDTLAFMFETRHVIRPTRAALESAQLQPEYFRCWQGLRKHFTGNP